MNIDNSEGINCESGGGRQRGKIVTSVIEKNKNDFKKE